MKSKRISLTERDRKILLEGLVHLLKDARLNTEFVTQLGRGDIAAVKKKIALEQPE